jgi:hypothetical protein
MKVTILDEALDDLERLPGAMQERVLELSSGWNFGCKSVVSRP